MTAAIPCAEIIWKIENFSSCWHKKGEFLSSPDCTLRSLNGSSWNVRVYPGGFWYNSNVTICLVRADACQSKEKIDIKYEMTLLAHGLEVHSFGLSEKRSVGKYEHSERSLIKPSKLFREKNLYLPKDVFTLRVRIWNPAEVSSTTIKLYFNTCVPVKCFLFTWKINKFSTLMSGAKKVFQLGPLFNAEESLTVSLTYLVYPAECIKFEILGLIDRKCALKSMIRLLDASQTEYCFHNVDISQKSLPYENTYFPLKNREQILKKQEKYLIGDVLSLDCLFCVTSHEEQTKICTDLDLDSIWFVGIKEINYEHYRIPECKDVTSTHTLYKDIFELYQNKELSDVNLQVESQLIPVHSFVLGSRSLVFKKIFQTDMKEKISRIIDIKDLDITTVTKMLDYMYTDDVGEICVDECLKLYYAADKYEITGLVKLTFDFLKNNLSITNVLDILVLADQHNDQKLEDVALKYMVDHEKETLFSEDFDSFSNNNAPLAFQVMKKLNQLRLFKLKDQ